MPRPILNATVLVINILVVLGSAPLWAEFQVNSFTTNSQRYPAVSHDSGGGFVVVWSSLSQDGSNYGIFGQRFNSGAIPLGGEFQINTFTANHQTDPKISHDSAGGFVVVWESINQDGDLQGIFGQRFDSDATPLGGEFQINSFTTGKQGNPALSRDSAGSFVVVWYSYNQDGSYEGVFGQRFDSNGIPQGGEFQINSFTTNRQEFPAISHDSGGGFVVVWSSRTQDGPSNWGVFGQRFDSDGIPLGGEFQVNTFTAGREWVPDISHDSGGGFVVVWEANHDGSLYGVFGQRFGSDGTPLGGEFQINTVTAGWQDKPRVSHDSRGRFAVVWQSGDYLTSDLEVSGQRFDSSGTPLGGEFQVNSFSTNFQINPAISHDPADRFVIVWESNTQDGSGFGIFGRRIHVPIVVIDDALVLEGQSGSTSAIFLVLLSQPPEETLNIDYATADGSATAGSDYTTTAGTLSMLSGQNWGFLSVPVLGDTLYEADEAFWMNLSTTGFADFVDPSALGVIFNDDDPPGLDIQDLQITEGDSGTSLAQFTVNISEASGLPARVDFSTFNGTATAGEDYTAASGTLLFPAFTTGSQTASVTIHGDLDFEPDETFFVQLTLPVDATVVDGLATGTILNDDGNFLILTGPAAGGGSNIRRYQGS